MARAAGGPGVPWAGLGPVVDMRLAPTLPDVSRARNRCTGMGCGDSQVIEESLCRDLGHPLTLEKEIPVSSPRAFLDLLAGA
ncbi:MAG TPA: hypothetical protein VKG38_14760 [Solirubrobacteraceae bacterium]|nr:hypothetical protein [Solirubrobacteraceae bacterium]